MATLAQKVIEKFVKSKKKESFDIELDNLDYARLVYNKKKEVVVENEHCT